MRAVAATVLRLGRLHSGPHYHQWSLSGRRVRGFVCCTELERILVFVIIFWFGVSAAGTKCGAVLISTVYLENGTVRNYKNVKRGLHFYAKSGMISQARKSTTHCEDKPVAVWDFAPRSDCCEAIAGRRLRLFLPSVSKERSILMNHSEPIRNARSLGIPQNADFGSPAHVCHVWRNGAGANSGPKLRFAPVHSNDPAVCRHWNSVFFTSAPS